MLTYSLPAPSAWQNSRAGADRESLQHFAGLGVDGRGVAAGVVDGEHALGLGLVADRVRIPAGGRLAALGQRLQIENGHAAGLAVGDEPLAQIVGDGDSVHAVQPGNGARPPCRRRDRPLPRELACDTYSRRLALSMAT